MGIAGGRLVEQHHRSVRRAGMLALDLVEPAAARADALLAGDLHDSPHIPVRKLGR